MSSLNEQLEKFTIAELRAIILDMATQYPFADEIIGKHWKSKKIRSGVCVSLEYDTFYIAMSKKEYDFLCNNYEGIDLGDCCGHVGTNDMKFLEVISDKQMNIDSYIKEDVEEDIFEFLNKHRDEISDK